MRNMYNGSARMKSSRMRSDAEEGYLTEKGARNDRERKIDRADIKRSEN